MQVKFCLKFYVIAEVRMGLFLSKCQKNGVVFARLLCRVIDLIYEFCICRSMC